MSAATHQRVRSVFLRGLGLVVAAACASLALQIEGLVGAGGIAPVQPAFEALEGERWRAFWEQPCVFVFGASDARLLGGCWLGVALGLLALLGCGGKLLWGSAWLLVLSLGVAGQVFLGFQWDLLLVESCFLAAFWAPWDVRPRGLRARASWAGLWLVRLLVVRLMLLSGATKLLSGDEAWWSLSALEWHFWTQPLPTPLAVWAHSLPPLVLRVACAAMFAVELALPLLVFAGRRWRLGACAGLVGLQLAIALSGNYGFFNALTAVLCVSFLDDRALGAAEDALPERRRLRESLAAVAALPLLLLAFLVSVQECGGRERLPERLDAWALRARSWRTVSGYGLFRVMTRERPELVLEGSVDGEDWQPYALPHKPGDVRRGPRWCAAHMPRLDWQLWFSALEARHAQTSALPVPGVPWLSRMRPWFALFLRALLRGEPAVRALLAPGPFEAEPPRFLRVRLFLYGFPHADDPPELKWRRRPSGLAPLVLSLDARGELSWVRGD